MIDGLKTMCCSGCGEKRHLIFRKDGDFYTECIECESLTKLSVTKPKIQSDWVDDSDGVLCQMD